MKTGDRKNIETVIALTPMQEGMLYHYLKDPQSGLYCEQLCLETIGNIDLDYFQRAWNRVVETNEMMRVHFRWEKINQPVQAVLNEHRLYVSFQDLSTVKGTDRLQKRLEEIKREDRAKAFNLKNVPFRVLVCKVREDCHWIILSFHHILFDGWSTGILLEEFLQNYRFLLNGEPLSKLAKKPSYALFVKWHNKQDRETQKHFWREYLADFEGKTQLPVPRKPKTSSLEACALDKVTFSIGNDLKEKIDGLIKARRVTLAGLFFCAWGILLQRYCDSDDVVFGSTVSGRSVPIKGIERMVGLFINTIPLRIKSGSANESVVDLLQRVNRMLSGREKYENTPLVDIYRYCGTQKGDKLFDSIVVVENYPMEKRLHGVDSPLEIRSYSIWESTNYDISLSITGATSLTVDIIYFSQVFHRETIQRMGAHLNRIIESMVKNPLGSIGEIDLLSELEREQLLVDFNAGGPQHPVDKTVSFLFEQCVQKSPDLLALNGRRIRQTDTGHLTYRQLHLDALKLSRCLMKKGARIGDLIGLMAERCVDMIIAVLAILKSGCGYVPLNPKAPVARSRFMLRDCNVRILLSTDDLEPELTEGMDIVNTADAINRDFALPDQSFTPISGQLAYVIYTSGSTGNPKGVPISHANLSPLLHWGFTNMGLGKTDRCIQNLSYYFDWSAWEIFTALTSGSCLYMVSGDLLLDSECYIEFMNRNRITVLHITPTHFQALVHGGGKLIHLKHLALGAEKLSLELMVRSIELVGKGCRIYNMYGPTEATIMSAVLNVRRDKMAYYKELSSVPIGPPIANSTAYILDRCGNLQPVGVPGELWIGGSGVSRGYVNNPELTAERFIHRIINAQHLTLYKTGDWCRWLPDGTIEFHGRLDQQVKIRGFRIEPGEIENRLLEHPNVHQALVIPGESRNREKYLCAYIILKTPGLETAFKDYLTGKIPGYMVPSYIMVLEQMPLTPNGKVDIRALPKPAMRMDKEPQVPLSETQSLLAASWAKVLGIDEAAIDIDSDFFELGGHSLSVTRLSGVIQKELNTEIPFTEIFVRPTIRELAQFINGRATGTYEPILPVEEKEYYTLSPLQESVYVLQQMDTRSTAYSIQGFMELQGKLDPRKFQEVCSKLIRRHESFRTSFHLVSEIPAQVVHQTVDFSIEKVNLIQSSGTFTNTFSGFIRPFDLAQAPLLRVGLAQIDTEKHILMVDMHHIISDGISMGVFIKEFMALYSGEALPTVGVQYRDFAEWFKHRTSGEWLQQAQAYWVKQFRGEIPQLNLFSDYPRPAVRSFAGSSEDFTIENGVCNALKRLANDHSTTMFGVLESLYILLLAKVSGQEDIVAGVPIASRRHPDTEQVVGMFVNTLAMRHLPEDRKTIAGFIRETGAKAAEAFQYQDYPLEYLVEQVAVSRDTSRSPLFDTMFVFLNLDLPEMRIPGLEVKPVFNRKNTSKVDLTLVCNQNGDQLSCSMEYSTDLFKTDTVQRLNRYYRQIIVETLNHPDQQLRHLDIIPDEEKKQLLFGFSGVEKELSITSTIDELFEMQVDDIPDHSALVFIDQVVTYRHLDEQANKLANFLRMDRGVCQGDLVFVLMERSIELIITLIGVLKAGAAYIPLDPDIPLERLRVVFNDAATDVVITQHLYRIKLLPLLEKRNYLNGLIYMDDPGTGFQVYSVGRPGITGNRHPAYIMYTSGSTGIPKGVLVEHCTIVNTLVWRKSFYEYAPGDASLQVPPYFFDSSVTDIFTPLLGGGRLVLVPEDERLDLDRLKYVIPAYRVTHFIAVPAFYNVLVSEIPHQLKGAKMICCAGEHFPDELIRRHFDKLPRVRIINEYGPTENSVNSTVYEIRPDSPKALIGKPITNVKVTILDRNLQLCPIGVGGEICLGGAGLARGYLNRPELTAERFVQLTLNTRHLTLYQTGDLARWFADGNLEFLGRLDRQVKIRGIRVETEEIESQLLKHDNIKEAVVLPREDTLKSGERYLCAYVVSSKGKLDLDLRRFLAQRLPEYMIPAHFIELVSIPFTASGKIDRTALPAPREKKPVHYAPSGFVEKTLAGIWSNVLHIDVEIIGIDDDFFRLGGQSLSATTVATRIHKTLDVKIPLIEIFTNPTIRELAQYMENVGEVRFSALQPVEEKEFYFLSAAQKRIYLLQQLGGPGMATAYNLPSILELNGCIDKPRIENTFMELVKRHESLRTSFHMIDEQPVQVVHGAVDLTIGEIGHTDPSTPVNNSIAHFIRPFDLSSAPLMRIGLVKIHDKNHLLMVDMHHIVSDGTSAGVLVKEFMELYEDKRLAPLRVQYKDYSHWLSREHGQQELFWVEEFEEKIPVIELFTDHSRPRVQSFEGHTIRFRLNSPDSMALNAVALENKATLFMVLLSIFNILLAKLSSQEELVVGTPVAGRPHADLEGIIGMFVNTLALRTNPAGRKTVNQFLHEVKEKTLAAYAHQDYPYESLVERIAVKRDTGRNPLFDTFFVLQNMDIPELELPGLTVKPYDFENRVSKFDLSLYARESGGQLHFSFEYCTALFREETIQRFIGYFKMIAAGIIRDPYQRIAHIEWLTEEEKQRVLFQFNDTESPYPGDKTYCRLFEDQMEKFGDRCSVVSGQSLLTYSELNLRANRLSQQLREKGVGPNVVVAVKPKRSLEMIVGILGILKAGGAYLPIDPEHPEQRIEYMLKDSNAALLVESFNLNTGDSESFVKIKVVHLGNILGENSHHVRPYTHSSTQLCYVIYTSGSTGRPKGVMIEHKALLNLVYGINKVIGFGERDTILSLTTISFDIFGSETLLPLSQGSKVVIGSEAQQKDPEAAGREIRRHDVTIFQTTPSRLQLLSLSPKASNAFMSMRCLMVGGEALPVQLLQKVRRLTGAKIYNIYGPTETTIWSTIKDVTGEVPLNIGAPIANTQIYILDRFNGIQPVGVVGELCIGGDGLARGYANRPELTAEKFVHLLLNAKHLTVYRTGDLARWLPDGNIEFLGRIDHQVKIRGFRIELGEIENRLLELEPVEEAVVISRDDAVGDNVLCAYIVAGDPPDIKQLKIHLARLLPDYMIPANVTLIDKIPLNRNGKVDRGALPDPQAAAVEKYEPPSNLIQRKLVEIWAEILDFQRDAVGIDDNFFDIGGQSLKALTMTTRILKDLNVNLTMTDIFNTPDIRRLSQFIQQASPAAFTTITPVEEKIYYPLSPAQRRIFVLQQMDLKGTVYNIPSVSLMEGCIDIQHLTVVFHRLIRRHDALRTSFRLIDEHPVQVVHSTVEFVLEEIGPKSPGGTINDIIAGFVRPFELDRAPLLRVGLLNLEEFEHLLIVDMHHIISDGTSIELLVTEFMELYMGQELPELTIQYKDYAQWWNNEVERGNLKQQETYWLNQFEGEVPVLELPLDFKRPQLQSFEGNTERFFLEPDVTDGLNRLAAQANVTLFMVLTALVNVVFSKITGQHDIVLGTVVAGRHHPDLEKIIGMFVNTLPLRNAPLPHKTFREFLAEVKTQTLAAFENGAYPLEDLVEQLGGPRDKRQNPLFEVVFTLNEARQPSLCMDSVKITPYPLESRRAKFDIAIVAYTGESLAFEIEYRTKLFTGETIRGFARCIKDVARAVLDDGDTPLQNIAISHQLVTAKEITLEKAFNF